MKKRRGAMEMDMLGWVIVAVVVLAVVVIGLFFLKDKGVGAMQYLKNLFRFGA